MLRCVTNIKMCDWHWDVWLTLIFVTNMAKSSAGTQRGCRLSLALSESVRHFAHWIRLRDCTSHWTKRSLIWDQRRIWAPHPLLDCECSGSVMTMRTCVTTRWVPQPRLGNEMGSGKFLRPDWMAENMAAWNIPPSLWCGVPNVSVQDASRAHREGISQQPRSACISAPLMIIEENVKMKNREGVWDTF